MTVLTVVCIMTDCVVQVFILIILKCFFFFSDLNYSVSAQLQFWSTCSCSRSQTCDGSSIHTHTYTYLWPKYKINEGIEHNYFLSQTQANNGHKPRQHLLWFACLPQQTFLHRCQRLDPTTRNLLHQLKWILNAKQLTACYIFNKYQTTWSKQCMLHTTTATHYMYSVNFQQYLHSVIVAKYNIINLAKNLNLK